MLVRAAAHPVFPRENGPQKNAQHLLLGRDTQFGIAGGQRKLPFEVSVGLSVLLRRFKAGGGETRVDIGRHRNRGLETHAGGCAMCRAGRPIFFNNQNDQTRHERDRTMT